MKEIPILFSTPMVQAILDDRKNMTRRVINPQPTMYKFGEHESLAWQKPTTIPGYDAVGVEHVLACAEYLKCPYGKAGDRLWVRETTWISECKRYVAQGLERGHNSKLDIVDLKTGKRYIHQSDRGDYAITDGMITSWSWRGRYLRSNKQTEDFSVSFADVDTGIKIINFSGNIIKTSYNAQFRKKLPSIYMPKVAARIWLEVTNVRVERLQEINGYESQLEGIDVSDVDDYATHRINEAKRRFVTLWESINSKRGFGWEVNPWVWVVEFKRIEV